MPPYADNLYSGDDDGVSDTESFSDELTPSDGYFHRANMPSHGRLVPDPTIDYGPAEAKTLIESVDTHPRSRAGPSHTSSSQAMSSSSPPFVSPSASRGQLEYTPVSPVSSRRREPSFSEHEPLMYQPPPAYSETPPPSHPSPEPPAIYSTFPFQHLERGFPLARQEPQSMGGPITDATSEDTPLMRSWMFSAQRKRTKALLLAGFVLVLIGTTLSVLLGCSEGSDSKKEKLLDVNAEYCPSATIKEPQTAYEFSGGKSLNIIHRSRDDKNSRGHTPVSTEGEIRLRRAPNDSKHGRKPYITVDMGSTTHMTTTLDWMVHSQTLRLTTPATVDKYSRSPCLYVIITAFIPEDTELTSLLFDTPSLNLALSDTKLNVTGHAQFSTVSGDVWLTTTEFVEIQSTTQAKHPARRSRPESLDEKITTETELQLSSRKTVVETVSGSITGTYPLQDELLISSQSGDITVTISPKAASKTNLAPADLEVQTASGTIRVDLPLEPKRSIPNRDYITRVHSTSGDVSGTYYLGSDNHFKTTSGSITFEALPVLQEDNSFSRVPPNVFETHSVSGDTKVSVLDPIIFSQTSTSSSPKPYDPYDTIPPPLSAAQAVEVDPSTSPLASEDSRLRSLRSSHSTNTGTIKTEYPDSWEGSVHVRTVSGDIQVRGDGFRTVKDRNGWAYKEVLKKRGVDADEGSKVEIGTVAGSVDFEISA